MDCEGRVLMSVGPGIIYDFSPGGLEFKATDQDSFIAIGGVEIRVKKGWSFNLSSVEKRELPCMNNMPKGFGLNIKDEDGNELFSDDNLAMWGEDKWQGGI